MTDQLAQFKSCLPATVRDGREWIPGVKDALTVAEAADRGFKIRHATDDTVLLVIDRGADLADAFKVTTLSRLSF